jgi:hypothetical protein
MLEAATKPPKIIESRFGPGLPDRRAADLPGISSLDIARLFPGIPSPIYSNGDDLSAVGNATRQALSGVDMEMIGPQDSVNLLCSEHGFSILEGEAYAQMLRTIKDVVEERTGCKVRLRFCVGASMDEAREIIPHFELDQYFEGRVKATGPVDRGVAIETDIGTLHGLARVYDADWIIHAHYDDPREVYFHRLIDRSLKAFTMSYARLETRSVYHMNFGSRSSNIVPRAIFDSPFVQQKYAFTCFLVTSPAGVTDIEADNDHHRLNHKLTVNTLKGYGKLMRLFAEIDECVAVLDAGRWPWYLHAGGLTSGNLFEARTDYLDLDIGPSEDRHDLLNPAVRALVVNHCWRDLLMPLSLRYPIFVAGQAVADGLTHGVRKRARVGRDLEHAMEMACKTARTDKVIIFDGSYGHINLTPSLGEFLIEEAPRISQEVDRELLPKWLRQRGIDETSI